MAKIYTTLVSKLSKNFLLGVSCFLTIVAVSSTALGQTNVNMTNGGNNVGCNFRFYDSGGPSGNYANNQNLTHTFCAPGTQEIRVQFNQFITETNYDWLYIYDGPNTAAPLKWAFTGSASGSNFPPVIYSTNGCLTFNFQSDGSNANTGWDASITCVATPVYVASDFCAGAPIICDLSNYLGNTSSFYTTSSNETCSGCLAGTSNFNGSLENNSWISFIAGATTASFNFSVSNCTNGDGIQVGIYSTNCSNSWQLLSPVSFTSGSNPQNGNFTVTANGLVPGQQYYIMVDGYAGDVCNYSLSANTGVQVNATASAAPATICPGQSTTVTANAPGTGLTYTWSSTPAGGPYPNTSSINVSPTVTTTYTVLVNGYCGSSATATTTVTIGGSSNSTWTAPGALCTTSNLIDLNGQLDPGATTGGTWSGPGVTGSAFNPATAGPGTHSVTYSVGSGACASSTSHNIVVNPAPVANWTSPPASCVGAPGTLDLNTYLNSGSTSGGTWSGSPHVTPAGIINLGTIPAGNYSITYSVNSGGCSASQTNPVNINPLPQATWTPPIDSVCQNFGSVDLNNFLDVGTLHGGTWTGNGVSGNIYAPTAVGTFPITYSVADGAGCSNSHTVNIKVNPLPNASFSGLSTVCVSGNPLNLTPATSGGTFSGQGISGNTFNPSVAGVGTHPIKYVITNSSGCSDSTIQNVTVSPNDNASFQYNSSTFCVTGTNPLPTINGLPGGTFSGSSGLVINASNGEIDLSASGVGSFYAYYTTNGSCPATDSVQIGITNSAVSADFNYINQICHSGVNLSPTFIGSGTAGTFSSSSGLSINSSTGVINVGASTPGTYIITNTIPASGGCAADSHTDTLTINPLPNADFSGLNSSYCSTDPASNLSPATIGGTFIGSGIAGNTFNPQIVAPGSYTISYTITDANGCTDTVSHSTLVRGQVSVSVTQTGSLATCAGYSDTLTASGNASTYSWYVNGAYYTSVNPFVFDNIPAGGATVQLVGNANNYCPDTVTLNYSIQPPVSLNLNVSPNQTVCEGSTSTFTASGATQYSWYNSSNSLIGTGANLNLNNNNVGSFNYSVIGTSNNACPDTINISIVVNPKPVVTGSANPSTICAGQNVSLSASANTGTISWSNGGNNPQTVNPTSTTTYWATAITSAGCRDSIIINVTVNPKPNVTVNANPSTICEGESSLLTANTDIGTLVWNNGGTNPQSVSPISTTTYWAVSTTSQGCKDSVIATVTVNSAPSSPVISLSSNNICLGNNITISAGGTGPSGTTYTLYDSPTGGNIIGTNGSVTLTPSSPGTYHIYAEAVSAAGCPQLTPRTDSVYVVNDNPTITGATVVNATCGEPNGEISGIIGSGSLNYTWTNLSGQVVGTSANLGSAAAGVYQLSVTDQNTGCTSTYTYTINNVSNIYASFSVNDSVFTVGSGPAKVLFYNNSINAISYSWNFDNGLTSTQENPNTEYYYPGVYQVILEARGTGNCIDYDTLYIRIIDSLFTWYPNIFTPNGDNINDVFFIKSTEIEDLEVKIYNRWGNLVYMYSGIGGFWDGRTMSGSEASDGDYYFILFGTYKNGQPIEDKKRTGYIRLIRGKK